MDSKRKTRQRASHTSRTPAAPAPFATAEHVDTAAKEISGRESSRRDFVKMAATGIVGAAIGAVAGNYYGQQSVQLTPSEDFASLQQQLTDVTSERDALKTKLTECTTEYDLNALESLFVTLNEPVEMLKEICSNTCEARCVQQMCTIGRHLQSDLVDVAPAIDAYLKNYDVTVSTIDEILAVISTPRENVISQTVTISSILERYGQFIKTLRNGGKVEELATIDVANDFALSGSLMWYAKERIKQRLHDKDFDKAETLINFEDAAFAILEAHLKKAKDALKDAKEGAELFLKSAGAASGAEMIDRGLAKYSFDEWGIKGYVRFYEAIQRMRDICNQIKLYVCSQERFDIENLENYDNDNAIIKLPATFAKRYFVLPEYVLSLQKVADATGDSEGFYKMLDELAKDNSDHFVYWLKKLSGSEDKAAARYAMLKKVGRLNIDTFLEAVVDNSAPLQIESPLDHYHAIAVKIADEAALMPDSKSAEEIILQRIREYVPKWQIKACAFETKEEMFSTQTMDGPGFGIMFSDIYKMAGWDSHPANGQPANREIEAMYVYNVKNAPRYAVAVVISENGQRQMVYSRNSTEEYYSKTWDEFLKTYGSHHFEIFKNELGGSVVTYAN